MSQCLAKCTNCGTILQVESTVDAAVCPSCGKAFVTEKAIENYNLANNIDAVQQDEQPAQKVKKNNFWTIMIVIILVIGLLIGGHFIYVSVANKDANEPTIAANNDALSGRYVSESGQYEIVFKKDFTCTWYQEMYGNNIYFDGTYEKVDGNYILHMDGESYSYNTRFVAEPTDEGLFVTGGVVDGELFVKQ